MNRDRTEGRWRQVAALASVLACIGAANAQAGQPVAPVAGSTAASVTLTETHEIALGWSVERYLRDAPQPSSCLGDGIPAIAGFWAGFAFGSPVSPSMQRWSSPRSS